jgi:DNA-binding XRE family transcriptional regulator
MVYKAKQDREKLEKRARAAAQRVRKVKDKRGMTYTEMGTLLGVSRFTVFRWCHGKTLPVFPGALEEALDEIEGRGEGGDET